jgi:hypothetical protein
MLLSQEVLEMSSLSVNTQLNTTLHVSEGGCQNLWCHQSSVSTAGLATKLFNKPPLAILNGTSNPIGLHNEHSLFQRILIHLHYDVIATKEVAQPSLFIFIIFVLSYLIFSCCQLPFCEFPKNTTAFH